MPIWARIEGDVTGYVDVAGTPMLIRREASPECDHPVLAFFRGRLKEGSMSCELPCGVNWTP
jgi:hypothetical protein